MELKGKYTSTRAVKKGQPVLARREPKGGKADLGSAPVDIPIGAKIEITEDGSWKVN